MTSQLWGLILSSALLHALWNFGAKKVSGNLRVFWMATWVASLAFAPWALRELFTGAISMESWARMIFTGLITAVYTLVLARAYRTGDLSFVYPVARGCGVAGAAICGKYLLSETVSREGGLGILAVCLGTVLMSFHRGLRQSTAREELFLSVLTGGLLAISAVNDKLAMACTSPSLFLFAMYAIPAVLLTPLILKAESLAELRRDWRRLGAYGVLVGVGSPASYGMVLLAFRTGPVSYIVPARELAVVVGSALGIILLREPISLRKGLGIASITLGLVLIRLA